MSYVLIVTILIAAAAIGAYRHESERIDASVDDIDNVYDPEAHYRPQRREPPSV